MIIRLQKIRLLKVYSKLGTLKEVKQLVMSRHSTGNLNDDEVAVIFKLLNLRAY